MKIEFKNVSFKYHKKSPYALKNVNLEINQGEILFLLGHSGSGKSTLLSLINGLNFPSEGEVKVNINNQDFIVNKKLKKINKLRENIGFIFQIPENQLFESNVLNDVMFGPENFGYKEKEAKELAKDALNKVGIDSSYYSKSLFKLSGGEKRKVALAGIYAYKPNIYLLDEPTASLDRESTETLFKAIEELKKANNIIVISSHNENLAYQYADKIAILNKGELTYFDNYKKAFSNLDLLTSSNIEIPFVKRICDKLNINEDVRDIKSLALKIKEAN